MKLITINGEEYPAIFGFMAFKKMASDLNVKTVAKLDRVIGQIPIDKMDRLLYVCIENGCALEGKKPPILKEIQKAMDSDLSLAFVGLTLLNDMATNLQNSLGVEVGEPNSEPVTVGN